MSVESTISKELDYIERSEGVKILFAVESGSRSWGFASPDSDYDVRFVYARRVRDYLALNEPRDVIEHAIRAEDIGLDVDFDAAGWDLKKFLKLMRASNPSVYEWLGSPTAYREDARWHLARDAAKQCFLPHKSAYHYLGMARKHDLRYMGAEKVPAKRYLYVIRAILAARWAVSRFTAPPVGFQTLLDAMAEPEIAKIACDLTSQRAESGEWAEVGHIGALDDWIPASIGEVTDCAAAIVRPPKADWDDLNDVYIELLGL